MQAAPRIVIIDNEEDHLKALTSAFTRMGTTCLGIHYNAETGVPPEHLRGVRALFLDLHLLDGAATSQNEKHFTVLADILLNGIKADGGPYVLVLWTENPEKFGGFKKFLEERLFGEAPHTRPLSYVCLSKTDFINGDTGLPKEGADLSGAIRGLTEGNPQLTALLAWEQDVLAAAGSALSTILELVPPETRTTDAGSAPLDEILSLLAREQVGSRNVDTDVRAAVSAVLAPILADRIMNRDPINGSAEVWQAAVTRHKEAGLEASSREHAGEINRMLHISLGDTETLTPLDWGAVNDFPKGEWSKKGINARFGMGISELLGQEMLIDKRSRDAVRPVLVRIGAACDHAQGSSGPATFLFGIIAPKSVARMMKKDGSPMRPKASLWYSPDLFFPGEGEACVLEVNCRFPVVMNREDGEKLSVLCRVREQLLNHLLNHTGSYSVRPGIVSI